jgi:AhpD family alkylhydroperoxidase
MLKYSDLERFTDERERLNEIVFKYAALPTKRFFSLDGQAYRDEGILPGKYKELIWLTASLVLRCDDCIKYHVMQAFKEGVTDEEFAETTGIALVVGGSIVIPHLRRAAEIWDVLKEKK